MKPVIEIQEKLFESGQTVADRLGISMMTINRWCDRGLLPVPIILARQKYFERSAVDEKLVQGQ
jgi:predicted site-specific integrase-resolvase